MYAPHRAAAGPSPTAATTASVEFGVPVEILGDDDFVAPWPDDAGMEEAPYDIDVHVKVPRWCCAIPALSVERMSYPVPTPSALEGMLSSIFAKPQIGIEIVALGIIKPGSPETLTRKELSVVAGDTLAPVAREWGGRQRTLRTMTYYRDSEYVVRARIVLRPHVIGVPGEHKRKYAEQFMRRVHRGAHYQAPYLGQREFVVEVAPATPEAVASVDRSLSMGPISLLGAIAYIPQKGGPLTFRRKHPDPARRHDTVIVEGRAEPIFFPATLRDGWLHVPQDSVYDRKRRLEGHELRRDGTYPDLVTPALADAAGSNRARRPQEAR